MPASVPPAPSLPGVAQTFCSVRVLMVSERLTDALPFHETVATLEIVPADVGRTVTVIGADVAPAASEPTLHVTGPAPAQPLWETKFAPAGMASVTITLLMVALV